MVQSDTPDFDLWAQVLMVLPDGSTIRLGEDIRRARFRDSQFKEEMLKPNQIVEIPFEFSWTAWRIPKGSRLRLNYCSSTIAPLNSPSYQRTTTLEARLAMRRSRMRALPITVFSITVNIQAH
jgi:predicted acyl esterase